MANTAKKKTEEKNPLKEVIFDLDSDLKRYDDFYKIVEHPDDPTANYKCVELIKGGFKGIVYRYGRFKIAPRKHPDGSRTVNYEYDIISVPDNLKGVSLPASKEREFSKLLLDIMMEIITDWNGDNKKEIDLKLTDEVEEYLNEPTGNNNFEGTVTRRTFYPFSKE